MFEEEILIPTPEKYSFIKNIYPAYTCTTHRITSAVKDLISPLKLQRWSTLHSMLSPSISLPNKHPLDVSNIWMVVSYSPTYSCTCSPTCKVVEAKGGGGYKIHLQSGLHLECLHSHSPVGLFDWLNQFSADWESGTKGAKLVH